MARVLGFKIEIIGTEEEARQLGILSVETKKVASDTKALQKSLESLRKEQVKDVNAIKNVTQRLGENAIKKIQLSEQSRKLRQQIRQEIKLQNTNAGSIGRVNAELAIEKRRILELEIGSRKFKDVGRRIRELEGQQRKFNQELGRGRTFVGEYERGALDAFKKIGLAIGGAVIAFRTLQRITGGSVEVITDFDDSIANLQKTTQLAKEEATELAREINKIDTKTSIANLLALGSAAGRLGLQGQDIVDFTREVDKAFVALGDSLEGDAEEIGLILGKIAANFDLEERFGIGEAINKVGSSLNELGARSKAQEGPIIDFTNRLAGVAAQAKISVPDLQALGALFDETGQSIEIASTTFNKLLPAIGADLTKFAKVAGLDVKDFRKIVEEDAFEALKLVAIGAQSSEAGLIGLTETLESFGIQSGRSASVIGILAGNTERLTELQEIANTAFDEGTSLTKEFNIQNNTLSARIAKAAKAYELFILNLDEGNGSISQAITLIVGVTTELLKLATGTAEAEDKLSDAEKTFRQVADTIIVLVKAVVAVTVGFIAYSVALQANALRLRLLSASTSIQSFVTGILDKKTRSATIAMLGFNKASKANVIGAIIGLLIAGATAFGLFGDSADEATEALNRQKEAEENLRKEREKREAVDRAEQESIEARISALGRLDQTQVRQLINDINARIEKLRLSKTEEEAILRQEDDLRRLNEAQQRINDQDVSILGEFDAEDFAQAQAELDELRELVEANDRTFVENSNRRKQEFIDLRELAEARLRQLQELSNRSVELTKAEQKALDALIKAQKKLFDDLIILSSTAFELENKRFRERKALLELEFTNGLVSRRELNNSILILEREHNLELDKIRADQIKKNEDEKRKELRDQSKLLDEELQVTIRLENEKFLAGKQSREELTEAIRQANAQRVRDELELINRELDQQLAFSGGVLDINEEQNEIVLARKEELLQELAELDVDDKDAQLQREQELQDQIRELRQLAIETTADIVSALLDRQLAINARRLKKDTEAVTKSEDEKLASLQNRLDEGAISEEEFERKKTNIEKESEAARLELRKEAFRKQQDIDTKQAIIAGALGIQRIIAAPFIGDLLSAQIAKALAIAGVIAQTTLSIDDIQGQSLAGGGLLPGTFDARDNIPVRLSSGEAVVNPVQQRRLGGPGAFRAAGVPGFQGGGVPLPAPNIPALVESVVANQGLSREEAVEIAQEAAAAIKVEQVETETRDIAAQVDLIENTAEV